MELPGLLKLKQRDLWALTVFCMLGLLVACVIPDPTWAIYASILVAFHCFVGWLIFLREERVKRPLPVFALISIHVIFVVIVVVLVSARQHIPRFGLLPIPLVAIGFSILSTAAGREQQADKFSGPRRIRRSARPRDREASRTAAPVGPPAGVPTPIAATPAPHGEGTAAVPQPVAPQNPAKAQPAALTAQPEQAAGATHQNGTGRPQPPAETGKAYAPMVPGVVLAPLPVKNGAQQEPAFFRDNSIAESIRQKHSEDLARMNPILAATAEDHEEWLKERGTHNPTHRKIGMSVREEYEQWLMARALARSGQSAPDGDTAASQPQTAAAESASAAQPPRP